MLLVYLLIAIATLLLATFQRVDLLAFYGESLQCIQSLPWSMYAWIVGGGCLLVLLMVILEQLKSYTMMYFLSRMMFEISLLGMCLLSFWSVFFAWKYLKNVWLDMTLFVSLPYLGGFVAMLMFQFFDFNYPYKKRVALGVLFSGLSIVLVFMHTM